MAGFVDVCSLVLTSAFFIGVILGTALLAQKCQALIDATKASLEERGWIVSSAHSSSSREGGGKGSASVVVVKTGKKKMDHERYLDATQRGVIKALNASTFGAPSSQSQTTANASASALAGLSSSVSSSSSFGGLGLGSTFTHFRSQLSLSPLAVPAPQPQPDQLVESASSGRRVGGPAVGGGAAQASGASASVTSATSDGSSGSSRGGGTTRDSLYDTADKFSAWPSEKIEKAKRLRDQFLSKV